MFSYTITDKDGDQSTATLTITINGQNDGVTVTVPDPADPKDYPVEDPDNPDNPTWGGIDDHVVFESGLVGGSQNSSNADVVDNLVMVKSSFTFSALDGLKENEAITFAVDGKADITLSKEDVEALSTSSKIIPTEYGELVLNGYSQAADGTITIDYEYTLTKAPENTAAGDGSTADKFTDDTIKITVNDRDTDTDSQDLVIRIMDDVPVIDTTDEKPALTVDETTLGSAVTVDFAGIFTPSYGADGMGVADKYTLVVTDGDDSGLVDTATGKNILLYQTADGIEGRIGAVDGDVAFKLNVTADGKVTLTQNSAVKHPDSKDPDDKVSLKDSGIKLELKITDTDGDTATKSVDIGKFIGFKDDGPTLNLDQVDGEGFVIGNVIVDEKHLPSGSASSDAAQLTVTKELPINFGADGAVNADGEIGLIFANTAALEALDLKSGTTDLTYQISADGHTITATAGGKDIFTIELKVATDGTPSYEFTLKGPLDHTLENDIAANIELPFDITATDGDGDSVDLKFKVEVVDDTPRNEVRELTVDEDGSVSFSNADINNSTTKITTDVKHGTVTIGNDGKITYTPNEDYRGSDSYTYTVTTASGTYERTVNITVKPVADAPLFADRTDGGVVVTPEDTEKSLDLTLPKIKDKGGQGDSNAEDYDDFSELLGAITLTPSGDGYIAGDTKFTTKVDGVEIELKPVGGKITIVITDTSGGTTPSDGYHVKGETIPAKDEGNGVYYLTKEEYEAITAHPAEDRHENFKVEVSVDSYEVDADGKKLTDVNGANSKQTITVDVQAVTDEPKLELKNTSHTFEEDTVLDLTDDLVEGFTDIDGSESFWYEVEGLAPGTVVTINGQSYTADSAGKIDSSAHKITVDAADKNPVFTIKPPKDFSGDMKGVKITLKVQDSDNDSSHTPAIESAEVTLDLFVNPIAGDVNKDSAHTIDEDNPVAFLSGIKVTDKSSDAAAGGEVITKIEFILPTDSNGTWTLSKQPTGTSLATDGWKVSNTGDAYTIEFNDDSNSGNKVLTQSEREELLAEFEVTPPAHSSLDAKDWVIKVTTQDSQTVNGNKVTSDPVETEHKVNITVKPVAERVDADSDGANGNDVTMVGNHVYQTTGEEDGWFALGTESDTNFKLSTGWSNEDGKWVRSGEDWAENTDNGRSEDTFALFTPYTTEDNDARANAAVKEMLEGSVFTYEGPNGLVTLPFAGEPVKIPMQYLDTVKFTGPKDWSGVVKIKVQAGTIDYDEDDGSATKLEVSGESWLTNLIIEPRADQVTLKVDTPIKTLEDTPVKLNIVPTSSDKNETFDVTISGIPKGATIKYWENGTEKTFTADADNSSLSITNFDKTKQPELTPPTDSNEPINLTVKAESVDTLTYIDKDGVSQTVPHRDPSKAQELPINVEVQGVPDEPILKVEQDKVYLEDNNNDEAGLSVDLKELITKFASGETGVDGAGPDGSETVTLRITDLPEGFTLTGAGPQLGGSGESRVWVISESQLNDVKISVPANYSGTVDFTVQPVVTENDNPSAVFFDKQNVSFKVNPVPEASLSVSSELIEDTVGKLDLSAVHKNGDTDEFISAVKIKAIDGVTFYSDAEGTTELTAVGGYYEISGEAVNSIYVKGPANVSGTKELEVEYKVTDKSADGTLTRESDWQQGSHNLVINAVTDEIAAKLNDISSDNDDFTFDAGNNKATIEGSGKVTVTVDISQQADANADGETDTDGSEQLTHIVIDGVPQGVSVEGAVQTGLGQWLLAVNENFNTEILTQDVVFNVTGVAGSSANNAITITGYSKDTGASSQQQADISFNLNINQGPGPGTELPTVTLSDKNTGQTEDVKFSLAEQVDGSISGGNVSEYQVTVTLRTSPDDETVYTDAAGNPLTRTEVRENGEPVILWTKSANVTSGDNADDKLAGLLDDIKVQAPEHANNNNLPDGLPLDVTVSVHANGLSKQDQLKPSVNLTPVTDDTTVTITAEPVGEGEDILINIELENIADGEFSNIEGNKITVTLDDSGLAGKLLGADGEPLTPTTEGGNTYEVVLVDGKPPQLTFRPDVDNYPHQTGSLGIKASVTATEQGATNSVVSAGSGSLVIEASNSGYEADITAQGDELNNSNSDLIKLELTNAGLIDSGEQIDSAFISGLPSGFTVWVDGVMANNAGGGTWAIPLEGNDLPANIAIKPLKNWAGTLADLKFTVMSGHDGLAPTPSEIGFELVVNPLPEGVSMNPTLSFGDAGHKIALNLNASMKDPSAATGAEDDQYTELTELSLSGFPDGQKVLFFIGDSEVPLDDTQATFENGTWTITGLSQEDLQNLSFLHANTDGVKGITVKGRTYEVDAEGNPYQENGETKYSAWSDAKMAEVNVSATVPSSGADHFLWDGSAINGFGGEDTVQLRFGDNLGTGDFGKMENIEIIDMQGSGANSITGLTVEDVFNMTDDDNILKIFGDAGEDTVQLATGWTQQGETNKYTGTHNGSTVTLELNDSIIID